MKMKKVQIDILINENEELVGYNQFLNNIVSLDIRARAPRKLVLEEIIGATHIQKGEYWSDPSYPLDLIHATGSYPIEDGYTVWRLV